MKVVPVGYNKVFIWLLNAMIDQSEWSILEICIFINQLFLAFLSVFVICY